MTYTSNQEFQMTKLEKDGAIFLIGLSASGKTTLAHLLVQKMRDQNIPCFLMDGCEMNQQEILPKFRGHDIESRKQRAIYLIKLVNWIASQSIVPVVAVIGQPASARKAWREQIENYHEVYLKCDFDVCVNRDNKGLYQAALRGEKKSVIGLDIDFDEPESADLILDSTFLTPQELLDKLWNDLTK